MDIYLGIDPGLEGCVAVISELKPPIFYDTPTLNVGTKREYDVGKMAGLLRMVGMLGSFGYVAIEKVQAMPIRHSYGNVCPVCKRGASMGSVSAFRMGYGLALWIGILAALKLPYTLVAPQRWKADMMSGRPKDKDASRIVASELFPSAIPQLSRKKDHNRADALLIAEWGRRNARF